MMSNITFAIDLQPGEIKAPAGTFNAAQMSYVYVEKGDKYTHGSKHQALAISIKMHFY